MSGPVQVRGATEDERRALFELRAQAFDIPLTYWETTQQHPMPLDRILVAEDGAGEVVGTASVHALAQYFHGRPVRMGGVAGVVVAAHRRGRGVAREMMTAALRAMRARGEVVSTLFPATTTVYRRLGWEVAGFYGKRLVPTRALHAVPEPVEDVSVRFGSEDDQFRLSDCYDRVAPTNDGWLDRPGTWWERRLTSLRDPHSYVAVAEIDGHVDGYVRFEHEQASDGSKVLRVHELVSARRDATLALWRFLGGHGSIFPQVGYLAAPEDPLSLLLPQQDIRTESQWRWMFRLVDAAEAIAARAYPLGAVARVPLQITDPTAPWNEGAFILEIADGEGRLTPGGGARVAASINALSAMYTGYAPASTLAHSWLLIGATTSELEELDDAFAGATPWLLDFF